LPTAVDGEANTLRVAVPIPPAARLIVDGNTLVLGPEGETVATRTTAPVKPLLVTVIVEVPVDPTMIVNETGLAAMAKSAVDTGDTIIGSHELTAGLLFASPTYLASKPNVPVELNVTERELGTVPPMIVTMEIVLGVPEQDPLTTLVKSW